MNRKRLTTDLIALVIIAPVAFAAFRCRRPAPPPPAAKGDIVRMPIGSETFTLEIADDAKEQEWGLMARDSMPKDHGMIFVFEEESPRAFWMKDTLIPLDILYLDASGRVVSAKQMKARDETPVPSDGPMKYAVELNEGTAKRVGVKAGDVLTIPKEILSRQKSR